MLKFISDFKSQKWRKTSFSQSGEDLIIKYLFDAIDISQPSYIDVGAYHPYNLSNTALFYENGSKGINIEPDPFLFKEFIRYRKKDINLNIGVGEKSSVSDFYVINVPTLNTFSKEQAEKYYLEGDFKIKEVLKIRVETIKSILDSNFNGKFPDFLSLDAEGIDWLILNSINFKDNFPKIICVETISFSSNGNGIKEDKIIAFLKTKGYILYADTNINSIFIRQELWENR